MVTNNQILLILTIPITIGAGVTIISFLATTGIIGGLESDIRSLSDQVEQQPALDDLLAQIPFPDPSPPVPITNDTVVIDPPAGFTATDQDLISAFLDAIGVTVTETFGVTSQVNLIDSDFASQIESSFVKVQPLDPRDVILPQAPDTENLRFFINTDGASRRTGSDGRGATWPHRAPRRFAGARPAPTDPRRSELCGWPPQSPGRRRAPFRFLDHRRRTRAGSGGVRRSPRHPPHHVRTPGATLRGRLGLV